MRTHTKKPLVIGLAGGTGSGKTTVSEAVRRVAGAQVVVLPQDAYYRAQTDLSLLSRKTNYDTSQARSTRPF